MVVCAGVCQAWPSFLLSPLSPPSCFLPRWLHPAAHHRLELPDPLARLPSVKGAQRERVARKV